MMTVERRGNQLFFHTPSISVEIVEDEDSTWRIRETIADYPIPGLAFRQWQSAVMWIHDNHDTLKRNNEERLETDITGEIA